mmetsp:Transcript_38390/g.85482  ORF Transcript_38390/g.85482 Transcript_38390/m.85482 type:complete len:146 (+) Transcript_38390:300-737(+)
MQCGAQPEHQQRLLLGPRTPQHQAAAQALLTLSPAAEVNCKLAQAQAASTHSQTDRQRTRQAAALNLQQRVGLLLVRCPEPSERQNSTAFMRALQQVRWKICTLQTERTSYMGAGEADTMSNSYGDTVAYMNRPAHTARLTVSKA